MTEFKELSKGAIKAMVKDPKTEQGKDHILQVYPAKNSDEGMAGKKMLMFSDGLFEVRGFSDPCGNYDVVNVKEFTVEEPKSEKILMVPKIVVLYSSISTKIGFPVAYTEVNALEKSISSAIPATAKPVMCVEPAVVIGKDQASTRAYKPLKALALYDNDWTVKVRLTSKGQVKACKNKQNEYVLPLEFMDEDGLQISALVCGKTTEMIDKMLSENKVYFISNGSVKIAAKKFTSVKNDLSLLLDSKCKIEEVEDDFTIKDKGFNFTQISAIAVLPEGAIIDVLGVVQSMSGKQAQKIGKGKVAPPAASVEKAKEDDKVFKRQITLCDESETSIDVSLWGKQADSEFALGSVIGIKRVRVGEFHGKQLSTMKGSEIVVDPIHSRVSSLKGMYT